jgi:hypothetical protein
VCGKCGTDVELEDLEYQKLLEQQRKEQEEQKEGK